MKKEGLWRAVLVVLGSELIEEERELLYSAKYTGIRSGVAGIRLSYFSSKVNLDELSLKIARAFTLVTGTSTKVVFRKNGPKGQRSLPYPPVLNAKFTFENFVVGASNRLTHAAVMSCGEKSGSRFNPVLISGEEGLGKTHLLQALCHRLLGRKKAYYVTARDFISAISSVEQEDALEDFRSGFQQIDVLLFDDLHLLAEAEGSKEEFFSLLNTMLSNNKLVVVSTKVNPEDLSNFEERILSRLNSGISFALERPSFETRLGIIKKMTEVFTVAINNDIERFIATRYLNGKQIEDVVHRIALIANASMRELSVQHVRDLLGDDTRSVTTPSIDTIQSMVSDDYGISRAEMNSKSRKRNIAWPRQIAMYLARELTSYSLVEIGGLFGGRDHTTIIHASTKVTKEISIDKALSQRIRYLKRKISEAAIKSGRNPS